MKYIKIQKYNYSYNYIHIYSFFVLRPEFQVVRNQSDNNIQKGIAFYLLIWVESGPYLHS